MTAIQFVHLGFRQTGEFVRGEDVAVVAFDGGASFVIAEDIHLLVLYVVERTYIVNATHMVAVGVGDEDALEVRHIVAQHLLAEVGADVDKDILSAVGGDEGRGAEVAVVRVVRGADRTFTCNNGHSLCKKSVISVRLSEIYGVPEEQVLLTYGGEDMLKNAIHYFLMLDDNKRILIPEFSWWYYNRVASECGGTFEMYPLYEKDDTFAYDVDEVIEYTNRVHPRMLLLASPNNPTGNALTPDEIENLLQEAPKTTYIIIDEAYASYVNRDSS